MTVDVNRIQRSLLDRRRELFETVARVEDDLRWLDTNVEPEAAEEGQEENIARLLARLDDRCEGCGERIPAARLDAMPTAVTCVDCAAMRERGPG